MSGKEKRPEHEIMRLSDSFCQPMDKSEMEEKMTHLDYTFEKREPLIREEGRQEGLEQGTILAIRNMISLGISEESILTKYSIEEYQKAKNTQ